MDTVVGRYEFLDQLHRLLKPRGYLEIGVQYGGSLALAQCPALGIDPTPMVTPGTVGAETQVFVGASDFYFSHYKPRMLPQFIDLAFIDGMHLSEFALRDFMNVERVSHSGTVIVFDDVLPYSEAIAAREQPPGDWTGDVWRVIDVLTLYRKDLRMLQVDTFPTGSLVVFDVNPNSVVLNEQYEAIYTLLTERTPPVPESILTRRNAISVSDTLETLQQWKDNL